MIGLSVASKRVGSRKTRRSLEIEPLEARWLLAVIRVNSFEDVAKPPPGTITLRSAIARANTDRRPDTIILPTGVYKPSGTLNIHRDGPLSIVGEAGVALIQEEVSPAEASSPTVNKTVFFVQRGARATFVNLAITHGQAHEPNGTKGGGGLFNRGIATLLNCTVANNAADEGGGILNEGDLRIFGSTIIGNAATRSGGGGIFNKGTVTIDQSRIQDNRASLRGGGLWNLATAIIRGSNGGTRIDGNAPTDLTNTNGRAEVDRGVSIGGRV